MPKDNEVDEKLIWSDDLAAVLEAASEASAVPLTWFANREFSPEQTKAWLCDTVDNTVADGAFSGELHGIAEEESGLTVAFTGCGPKSAANAKFLIWCAHFIIKHRDSLSDHAATVAELRAEVDRLQVQLAGCGVEIELDTPAVDVAKAWQEGYRQGVLDERTSEDNIGIAGFGAKVEPARNNPYAIAHQPGVSK